MRGKTGRCLFLYKKGAFFAVFFSYAARLFRRRILSSSQSIFGNCGVLVRVSAPYAALAFIVGTSHHDGAKTLLARVGATAAKFVIAAPPGA